MVGIKAVMMTSFKLVYVSMAPRTVVWSVHRQRRQLLEGLLEGRDG